MELLLSFNGGYYFELSESKDTIRLKEVTGFKGVKVAHHTHFKWWKLKYTLDPIRMHGTPMWGVFLILACKNQNDTPACDVYVNI